MNLSNDEQNTLSWNTSTQNLRVLMIEDDFEFSKLIQKRLRLENIETDLSSTLNDALTRLEKEDYDLIMLDLSLPDSFGLQTFMKIQEQAQKLPVLILTGLTDDHLAQEAIQHGAQDFLMKDEMNGRSLGRSIRFAIERKNQIEKWKKIGQVGFELATHDPLTRLPNRLLLQDRLENALAQARRNQSQIALLFIDVDNFKTINDTYGHLTGDEIIKVVAARLNECLREVDTVARLGGDEFIVLVRDLSASHHPDTVIRRIRSAFQEPHFLDNNPITISVSIGVSVYPRDGADATALLESADRSMYVDKRH